MYDYISIEDSTNLIRIRISDELLKEIDMVQKRLNGNFPDYHIQVDRKFEDYDSMAPTFLILIIRKDGWEIGYHDYDGFENLRPDDSFPSYVYLRTKNGRKKSDFINFLTGEERIRLIQKGVRYVL